MNYQQAFSQVIVLLPIDPGKLKHRKTRVVLYVAPTSIATPPWIGTHIYTSMRDKMEWSFLGKATKRAMAILEPRSK